MRSLIPFLLLTLPSCYVGLTLEAAEGTSGGEEESSSGPVETADAAPTTAPPPTAGTTTDGVPETTDGLSAEDSGSSGDASGSTGDEAVQWDPIVADGDRLYFVGNSYTGNTGGLPLHMENAWPSAVVPLSIETDAEYFWGQGLGSMYTGAVVDAIETGNYDICVITSGTVSQLERFEQLVTANCNHFVVYMTWGLNPTIGSMEDYRSDTASIVATMRAFEASTDARIVPSGLVYYDLLQDPPMQGLRMDWLYWPQNIHQNAVGIALNTYVFYAALMGESPDGIEYDFVIPFNSEVVIQGETIATRQDADGNYLYDEIVFDEDLRTALQERAWDVTESWFAGTTEFD